MLFEIFQIKDGPEARSYRYLALEELKQMTGAKGKFINMRRCHYEKVFSDTTDRVMYYFPEKYNLKGDELLKAWLEQIYRQFNTDRPEEYKGRSVSMGDIIFIGGKYWYCDRVGFKEVKTDFVPIGVKVGDGATMHIGSDRDPFHIIEISDTLKSLKIQAANFRRIDDGGPYTESQDYEITPDPNGAIYEVKKGRNGRWTSNGTPVGLGYADKHRDPHF